MAFSPCRTSRCSTCRSPLRAESNAHAAASALHVATSLTREPTDVAARLVRNDRREEADAEPPAQARVENRAEHGAGEQAHADRLRPAEAADERADDRTEVDADREGDQ